MISTDNPIDDESVPPTPESAIRAPNFRAAGQAIGDGLAASNVAKGIFNVFWTGLRDAFADLLQFALKYAAKVLSFFLQIIIKAESGADDDIAELAAMMLTHLLGSPVDKSDLQMRRDGSTRPQSISTLGSLVTGRFLDAFQATGELQPGDEAAKKFVNEAIGMAVDGWILDSVIGWVPAEFCNLENLTALDGKLRQSMGLGRMTHSILTPAIRILANTPLTWKLEKQFRTKLLSEGHAAELVLRKKLSKEDMTEQLARQGYPDKYIDYLIDLQEKFLGTAEAATRWLVGAWSREEAEQYLQSHGWSEGVSKLALDDEKQRRIDASRQEVVKAAVDSYVHRFTDVTELTKLVDEMIVDTDLRHEIIANASARLELNRSRLSEAKAEAAVIDGFWTITQYTEHLVRLGYNDDDVLVMQLLVQEKIKEVSDKTAKKDAAAAAAAASKKAKTAAATARAAQLEAQREHKDLTLATVHRAYVQGQITLPQLQEFLIAQKQAPEDIQQLLELAQSERADYQAAQAKKAKTNQKLAATTLSTAQLERSVEIGGITIDDFQSILTKQGVPDSDIALLVKAVQVNVQAKVDAKARHDAIAAKLAERGLSLSQFESAVRQGFRTMADFKKFLADNKYGPSDQAALAGLLQDRIDADKAAEAKKAAAAEKLSHKNISLAELERAVLDNLRPIADYRKALTDAGVVPGDVDTLVALLQRKIDDAAAAVKRKAEIAAKLAQKGISLTNVERAARLGIVSEDYYKQLLVKETVPAEDQVILVGLLEVDIAKVRAAKDKEVAAAAKLKNRPATLADLKHSVLLGIRTIDDYKLALKQEGFDQDAIELMASLAQDEIDQRKAAEARSAALAAKRTPTEIARADFEKAVVAGLKTLADYKAFLIEKGYDQEDQGILYDLLAAKVGP